MSHFCFLNKRSILNKSIDLTARRVFKERGSVSARGIMKAWVLRKSVGQSASLFCVLTSIVNPTFVYGQVSALQEVEVHAHPLSAEGLAQPTAILSGDKLSQALQMSIGATVAVEPGVRVQSFGEAAGRPVIHGLAGPRVRILEDRIGTLDVSVTSTDHAVAIEPFIADRIEIIKGASTLLYGSGAIGGIVDVHTGRIPHVEADKPLTGRIETRYAPNASRSVGAFRFDGGAEQFAWHLDGFGRDADQYEIPGFAESKAQRAAEQANDEDETRGFLPGSQLRNHGGAVGVSWVTDKGFMGLAVSGLEADYGLPGGHSDEEPLPLAEEDEEGNPTLALEQVRIDIEAARETPFKGIDSINLRLAINNYQHTEFEADGAAGTRFDNEASELRVELVHQAVMNWQGSVGIQYNDRAFSAVGDEAFVDPVDSKSAGFFWVGQREFAGLSLEAGMRYEQLQHQPSGVFSNDQSCLQTGRLADKDYEVLSGSLGAIVPLSQRLRFRLAVDYASRAPTAEELFSCGPHLASQTFEIGSPDLLEESAVNLSLTLDYQSKNWLAETTFYHIEFNDYIYHAAFDGNNNALIEGSGSFDMTPDGLQDIQDGLPVFLSSQSDASFTGIDFKAAYTAYRWNRGQLRLTALFDSVNARLDNAGQQQSSLPRIPASRYGFGVDLNFDPVAVSVNFQRVNKQDDTAEFERPSDAYNDLSAYIAVTLIENKRAAKETHLTVFMQGRNLTDAEQRNHSSFIKEFAPAPGRTLELGARYTF